jgi:carboxypeptidase Taq
MKSLAAYDELLRRSKEHALLTSCISLLGWDELTYMPPSGAENRGDQMAYLAGLQHEKACDARIGELLAQVESSPLVADADSDATVNLREWRRLYERATKVPRDLVEELARVTSIAQQEWNTARQDSDYQRFRPWLESILRLKRREAECLAMGSTPDNLYDALLDEHEPGAKTSELVALFAALRAELVPLATAIAESPRQAHAAILHRPYALDRQRIFGEAVAAAVGFDFQRGRLDSTAHPFCSFIGPGDCRITTRYNLHDFSESFFGVLHEIGHALYDLGLDPAHHGTPRGEAASLGLHESQSRLWENIVGRSRPFWQHFFPLARQVFPETLHEVSLDDFHRAVNHVERSTNRVQADEVTYDLHILIRFELERELVSGNLSAADLPAAWNAKYEANLGVLPENDGEGCLQDGHWSAGLFGYFPTYTLGNVFAAQLFAAAERDLGDQATNFSAGNFATLLGWLRDKIHRHGQRHPAPRLIEAATGSPPDHRALVTGLKSKFGTLYGLS